MSPIIAVIGSTGIQGGSVISTLLKDGIYQIRGITRNPTGPKALALAAQGVEMVKADLDDEASLVAAFKGVDAIYAVTDFFEPFSKHGPVVAVEIETAQGIALANAASQTPTLKHYIWSTLANGSAISGGKYVIPHFEGKNVIDAYIKSKKELFAKTTFLWNTYYASNLMFPMFTPNLVKSSGKYVWFQPTPASTGITVLGNPNKNVGPFVSAILKQPKLTLGRFVLASVEKMTHGQILEAWGRATGKETEYVEISMEAFDRLWPMWGLEMGSMLKMWEELGERSWSGEDAVTREDLGIVDGLETLEEWMKEADWGFIFDA